MAWYVRARQPDWPIFSICCLESRQVLKQVNRQGLKGCEVWTEDVDARQLDEKSLALGKELNPTRPMAL